MLGSAAVALPSLVDCAQRLLSTVHVYDAHLSGIISENNCIKTLKIFEPYLIQLGFLNRTPRGRTLTRAAYEHLGMSLPSKFNITQPSMWEN